jgi:hypothetical protein
LLVLLGLPRFSLAALASQQVAVPDWTQAMLLLITAYAGFEAALVPAGELKDPRRDSAFALLTGMAGVVVLYTLVQLTVVGILPRAAKAQAPVAAAFGVLLGPAGVVLCSLAAMVSTFGWSVGSVPDCGSCRRGGGSVFPDPAALDRAGSRTSPAPPAMC